MRGMSQHLEHMDSTEKLQLLQQLLCVRSPEFPLPIDISQDINKILAYTRDHRILVSADSIPTRNSITIRKPTHRRIENVIHSWAGPQLRQECYDVMRARGSDLPTGHAVTTSAYNLPFSLQLDRGAKSASIERQQLQQCYSSVLNEIDRLPADSKSGGKSVALCGISTGLFAFLAILAAELTIDAIAAWINARNYLLNAETVIVTASAGMSAAIGLDYTSPNLFQEHFPTFFQYGFTCLYDVFGSYYFTHLELIRKWPKSALYAELLTWLKRFGENAHVRTLNADGLFVANRWGGDIISTPQGQYASYWPSAPYMDVARGYMDPETQRLTDEGAIPRCLSCGGDMSICVRAAGWFNEKPYSEGEAWWRRFCQEALGREGRMVILEIRLGMNTPGVIRWPNEDLVRESDGKVRLVRLVLGLHANVPLDLEYEGLATYVDGDMKDTLRLLLKNTNDININAI
ncbi:hypothetical protein DM02DRAFT_643647 [Periconia macrospinosa]|uniref:Macro domain-containing protein n=1 Tax=Periconia macrospinosa TaxID=97972 RepID=A0A2V1DJD5_9PLEO|nr:hypothetical protein DM02DRAFT_643647 [Periconia macrospinosa]